MKVMITGGTGLIGRELIQRLLPAGYEVWVLSRSSAHRGLPEAVHVLPWDARTPAGWGGQLEEMDAVINLVGESIGGGRWTAARKQRILDSRLRAGEALVEAFRQAQRKPRMLIQASGINYYGADNGDQMLSAESPPGDDFLAQVCVAWEASTRPVEEMGVRRVVTRSGLVLARQADLMQRILLPFRLFVGGPLGGGHQWWSWIHIADEAGALQFLMENGQASGAFNLTAPHPVHMAEFGRILAMLTHRPYWFPVPAFGLRLLLGQMSVLVLGSLRAVPFKLQALGYPFQFEKLRPALEDILK